MSSPLSMVGPSWPPNRWADSVDGDLRRGLPGRFQERVLSEAEHLQPSG